MLAAISSKPYCANIQTYQNESFLKTRFADSEFQIHLLYEVTAVPLTFKPITSDVSSEELDRLDPP